MTGPPTYDGIGADKYIMWEIAIDKILLIVLCVQGGRLRMQLVSCEIPL